MQKSLLIATVAGISGIAGAAVGYKIAEKRLAAQFDERLQKETEEMRTFYQNVPTKKYSSPEEAVQDLVVPDLAQKALSTYQGQKTAYHKVEKAEDPKPEDFEPFEGDEEKQEEMVRNIFESPRDPDNPYLISEEEFNQNEGEFQQVNLLYYAEDDVLIDIREDVIEDPTKTTGLDFKQNFGWRADDDYIHVRNEKLRIDFEIVRHGSYAKDVLGVEDR